MAEIKQVLVPDIGDYKEVAVIEVMVKVGDTINAEDTLLTLETDKAAMDVPSPFAGVIKTLAIKVGDKVSQGSLILTMESNSATAAPQANKIDIPAAAPNVAAASSAAPAVAAKSAAPVMAQVISSGG
ncbi:MAG: biotin/lipoyl-containing protein, partial [Gallionella sp.]